MQSTKGRTRKKGKSSIKRRKSRAKNMKTENCIALRSMLCFFRLPYQRLKSVRVDRKSGGAQAGYWQNLVQIAKCCRPTGPGRILRILVACSTRKKKWRIQCNPKTLRQFELQSWAVPCELWPLKLVACFRGTDLYHMSAVQNCSNLYRQHQ